MENPGLERFSSVPRDETTIKVVIRRTALGPGPQTLNQDSPISNPLLMAPTTRQDLQTPPPPTGVSTPQPASAANGAPAAVNPAAEQARIDRAKMPGAGSTGANPAWTRAHQTVQDRLQVRRAHPLHQGSSLDGEDPDISVYYAPDATPTDSQEPVCENCYFQGMPENKSSDHVEQGGWLNHPYNPMEMEAGQRFSAYDPRRREWIYDVDDPDYFLDDPADSHFTGAPNKMIALKNNHPYDDVPHFLDSEDTLSPGSETWSGDKYTENEDTRARAHLAAVGSDDPVYPFRGWEEGEPEDTVDEHNLQGGDDTFRPHHPDVDRVMNQLQGLPDMSRNDPKLMEGVNRILDEAPDTEEGNRGADALAMWLNTIFDSSNETKGLPYEERLQRGKDAIDAHFDASNLSHKDYVKRLHDDWVARGGHATGEPRPVERFSARYTKPQQIVPDPSNPFPELESPIYNVGKCEGCGRKLYDSADSSGDPRGALGDHTVGTLDAAEYSANDVPRSERTGDRRMHGPSALICSMCDQDQDRRNRIEDKYLGHKAGDPTGGFHWQWQRQPDGSQKNVRVDYTYPKDRKGKWHNPGEKPGECYECDNGITGFHRRQEPGSEGIKTQAGWAHSLRAKIAETDDEFWSRQPDVVDTSEESNNWVPSEPSTHGSACETCYLQNGPMTGTPEGHDWDVHDWGLEPHQYKPFSDAGSRFSSAKTAETDEDFWARMEREHPGDQPTGRFHGVTPDTYSQEHLDPEDDYRDPDLDLDNDDLDIPENMSLRDHAHLLRSGVMRWDGDTRYPKYTHQVNREIRDSEGNRAYANEGHVIEHNTGHHGPVLPTEDNPEPHVLEYPWSHTYYPAGMSDDEGLVKGYNSPDHALHATHQLSLWGPRHPQSSELLKGYKYVGSEKPYDAGVKLPHEVDL